MDIEKAVSAVIKEIREMRKISQEKLANNSGLYRTYISNLERGLKSPKVVTLHKISCALNVDLAQIIALAEAKLPRNRRIVRDQPSLVHTNKTLLWVQRNPYRPRKTANSNIRKRKR